MVGAIYCMMPMVENFSNRAPKANRSSGTAVTGPQPISSQVSVMSPDRKCPCPVAASHRI